MCVVSMIMDHHTDKWWPQLPTGPNLSPVTSIPGLIEQLNTLPKSPTPQIPQADIDEFYKLLERAREYDKLHHEPHCELQEKKDLLIALAEKLGVTITIED